jgi:transcriptional regulator with XRE-family HTH domain
MTLNQAFAIRVREILKEKKMTQYKLEQLTGIYHSSMSAILNNRIESSNFKTMAIIIRELGYSVQEFFSSPVFDFENLDID